MDDNSLLFALNRRLSIFTRRLSVRLIPGLAVLVLAGGSASAWAQGESADPIEDFCDLVMVGGSNGAGCAALAVASDGTSRVSYDPAQSPWRVGAGPTADSGQALFSAAVGSGDSSCLRLRLREERRLLSANFWYTVNAGNSTGALTIALERDGEVDGEEILRESGEVAWTSRKHTVDFSRSRVVGIAICYEKGSGIGDAGLDWAGVDNIRLETAAPRADFCDLAVAAGSCEALAVVAGARVAYTPQQSPWVLGRDASGSGLALFSADVGAGESSCLQLRFTEQHALTELSLNYRVPAEDSGGMLTIRLQRDGEESEFILRRSSPEPEWAEFRQVVNLDRGRVSGLLACYQQGTIPDSASDRAGLDNLSFVYEYAHNRDEFCNLVIEGGSAGENCEWIRAVHSRSVDRLWEAGASFWAAPRPGLGRERNCLRLLLQPRLDSSVLTGLSFNYLAFGGGDAVEFLIQRVGQQNTEKLGVNTRSLVSAGARGTAFEVFTADLDLPRGPISNLFVCYTPGSTIPDSGALFELNAIQFEDEVIAVSQLRSRLPPRLFHIAQQPQSGTFAIQALNQLGIVIDVAVQTTLTVRSDIAGMRLNLSVPDTGQSASGEGEVSLPLRFSGEQNVTLEFDIPPATADGTTLAVTVSGDAAVEGDSRELALFDFCGLMVQGGRDGEGGPGLQQSCSDFAQSVSALRFDPRDKPWRLGEGPTAASGQALFSAELGAGERSCLRLRLREERQQLLAFNFAYTVRAGMSNHALTIALERDGEADEEVLRASGEVAWISSRHEADFGQSRVVGISICYEQGADSGDAGLDLAGLDNIRLETAAPRAGFCDLVVAGGNIGASCAALAEAAESTARVSYEPAGSPWRLGAGPPEEDFGQALFSAEIGSGQSSCLRLRLNEDRRLLAANFWYTVNAGTSTGTLTITLERNGQLPEEVLRESGEAAWTSREYPVAISQPRVAGIAICYEGGSGGGDAGLDRAGVDNIRLYTAALQPDFCDVAVAAGSCEVLDEVNGSRVAYTPQQSPWVLGRDAAGSGLALFSADVGAGESSCLQLRFPEHHALTELSLDYRVPSEDSGGQLTIRLQRDGEESEFILRRSSPEPEWAEFRQVVNLDRGRVSGLLACYQQGTIPDSASDRAGLDNLSFVYEYAHNRDEFCNLVIEGGSAGENCEWIRAVHSRSVDRLWEAGASFWAAPRPGHGRERNCLRLLLQPRLDSSVLTGLSFNFLAFGEGDVAEFLIQRVGQQSTEKPSVNTRSSVPAGARGTTFEVFTADLDLSRGPISNLFVCYTPGSTIPDSGALFELNEIRFEDEVIAVSMLRSRLPPRLFHIAQQPQSGTFAIQALNQLGIVVDVAIQTTLTVRSDIAGMRLSLSVPDTGQSASGEGEVSLPLRFSGEQNVTLEFDIPPATADGATLAVTVGGNAAVAGDSRELALFDFCGLAVQGGRDGEGGPDFQQSCSDFARSVFFLRFAPQDKPWRVGEGPTADSGQALFSAELGAGERSCLRLQLGEGQQLLAFNFAYTVRAGTSSNALTIALHRDGEADEEILRQSGELGWTEMLLPTVTLGRSPVAGLSICYEKGADSGDAGLDWAGVDNIRLDTVDPLVDFCDLAVRGGRDGRSCAALAESAESTARVSYEPAGSPWRLGAGPPEEDFGQALFSAEIGSGQSSCLRLRLREERRLLSANFWYTVNAGNSTGTLTITLERDGEVDGEEILRESGEVAWTSRKHTVDFSRSRVVGIAICYEKGSGIGDAGLDRAGVDNIRLETAAPRADFCDLAVAAGSCKALAVVAGARVAYTPQQSPWVLGRDAAGSGLALFSADVGAGESSCLQLRFTEHHALTELSLNYRVPSEDSGGQLTIRLQRDGEESEFILRRSSPEPEWAEFRQVVNLDRARVSGLLACYQQGTIPDSASDRAGLDNLSFVYEYAHNRDEFCNLVIEGGSAGENCEWIRAVHSRSVDRLWEAGASFWATPRPGHGRERNCLRLLLQPRLDSSVLTGLSFNYLAFGGGDVAEFLIQRVGQQSTEKPSVNTRSSVPAGARGTAFEVFTADLDLSRGPISNLFVCYTPGSTIPDSGALFELNEIRFEDEVIAVSMLRSRLPPRLFHIAQQPQSGTFAIQALNQLGIVVDVAIQTTLTVRSDIAGMRLSLSVPDTGQSASGEGEVSLPLRFSGEQNVTLEFDIPPATADGTTLAVTVSGDAAVAGDSRELALFDFCGLMVQGGRDGEGGPGLQQSCSDFARSVSALRFDPRDKPWRLGDGPTADSGQALFSAELGAGGRSCLRLRLREERQQLLAFNFAYTVRAGMSNHALTIALERDGEADEEVLRASGEVAWISSRHEADFGQSRVVGISICYEQGADSGDAGLDLAGLDNIRLETAAPRAGFCDLVVAGGNIGASCAALAEAAESTARVSYEPAGSPWRLGAGPPEEDFGQALFSAEIGSGQSSCLRLRLNEDRRLLAANFWYTVNAGTSTGTLTITLERNGQLPEEVLRESGEAAWTSREYPVAISQPRVAGIAICYEGGSGGGDAGLDRAGVDNIRLYTAALQPDFCDVAVAAGSCEVLDEVNGSRVAYTPQQSPWVLGRDAAGSGLALFSADVGSGESSCMQLRFTEQHALSELSLDYRVPAEDSGGMLTIRLQRDGEESEFILRRSAPEPEWAEFRQAVNLDRARVSGLLACYQQGTIPDSASDRAGLDNLSFVYEYAHNRDEFCNLVIEGGSAGENCEWIRAVHSRSVARVWEAGASFWAAPRPRLGFGRERNCLRLLLQPRLDSSVLTGLSFNYLAFGGGDAVEFLIQRVGQQNTEKLGVNTRSLVSAGARGTTFEVFTADLDLSRGPISNLFVCYTPGSTIPDSGALFELNEIRFEDEVIAVSMLRSRLPPRLFHIAQQPQSGTFAIQALNQLGIVVDVAIQTTLTVRSDIAGMRLSLSVPDTGQSASGEGEVSLPLRFSGEQNVTLEFDIPPATADGATLAVTVGGNAAVAGDSRELALFDFCGLAVQGGRDGEGGADFQQSCSDFARSVFFLRFAPQDKPWHVGEGPTADSGQALFSAELGAGERSCLRLQLGEGQQLLAFNFAYTVRAGTSSNALTIALHRDGEADEEILRQSGEQDWTEMQLPTAAPDRSPVAGLSICYEKGAGSGDAGLDWAGVDNIRLDTVDPLVDFCDLAVRGGRDGRSCAALAESAESTAGVSFSPLESPWRAGLGRFNTALFSAAVGSGESSCLRLRLRKGRQLLALDLDYTVRAGTSAGALTIALHRDGGADEEILRRSGERGWTKFSRGTTTPGRRPVVGLSLCYEKGAGGSAAGQDLAGVADIVLDTADPLVAFCDLYAEGSCDALVEIGEGGEKLEFQPADRPWLASGGRGSRLGLYSPVIGPDERSCLRLSLNLESSRRLWALNMDYTVSTGANSGALVIVLQRQGEAPEEILRASGDQPWTALQYATNLDRGRVSGIAICYEKGATGGDASMDWAGIASIRLLTADPLVDFCDVAVVGGAGGKNCAVLGDTSSTVVVYSPSADSWVPGDDGSGSDLALFSRAVPPGESACLQLRFPEERHVLVEVSLDYRLLAVENGGMLTIELQHDGGANELLLDRSSPEPEWTGFRRGVLTQSRVSGLLACYQQGTMAGLEPGRAGLDNLSFRYWYVHDPDRFCDLAVEGGSAGENCRWIRTVHSEPGHLPWGSYEEQRVSSSSRSLKPQAWVSSRLASLDINCVVLTLQPRLDGMILNGLSLALHSVGAISGLGIAFGRPGQFASFVSLENPIHDGGVGEIQMLRFLPADIDPARGLVTYVRVCNFLLRESLATLAINALEFQGYLPVLSQLESTLSPRLFHIARQSQSVNFTLQTLDQMGVIIDSTARTTLTVRSGVAGMRLSLAVPETGQSASGEGEVSLPLSVSGEQNVVLGFNIPLALANGTTLAVTVSAEEESIAGDSRELVLFDFCGPTVHGGRDDEGSADLQQSCSNFAQAVSALRFDPPDKPWRLAEPASFVVPGRAVPDARQLHPQGQRSPPDKPWRAPGQPDLRLFSPLLERGERSCMQLQFNSSVAVTGFSLYWFLASARSERFTIFAGRAGMDGEERVLSEINLIESWAPFSHTASSGQLSQISFCYQTLDQTTDNRSVAGVDNLRLEYTIPPQVEFTGDETVTKDDLLLAFRAVGACSEVGGNRRDCITAQLSALAANLGLGALDARMGPITEALLALDSTATTNAYDFDRSGVVDEVDFRVLLRYLAGLRGAALVETEGGDSPDEFILRAIFGR